MSITLKTFKDIALLSLYVSLAVGLGWSLNALIPWSYLTIFFSILKYFTAQINFMWNTSLMWSCVSVVLSAEIIYVSWPLIRSLIAWFKDK